MIYEYRSYTVAPGKMDNLLSRFTDYTLELFKKHDIKPVAFFTPVISSNMNNLIFILEFRDLAHREAAWASFVADPDWIKAHTESNKDGQVVLNVENKILAPTEFSPLR
ncbi:MAG: NIPSNAP family protein [Defluviitaleaceae bacterium]|nr:NIPSNAP family protein [Defluviitaleaceae bacterium]